MSFDLLLDNGDISFDELGQLNTVTGAEKLAQQIEKIIYESIGDNIDDPQYGTILRQMVGASGNGEVLKSMALQSIESALSKYQSYQAEQIERGQEMDNGEILVTWANIEVSTPTGDPRNMYITGDIINRAGEVLTTEVKI